MALQPVTTTRDVTVKFEGDLFKYAELNIVNIMYVTSIAGGSCFIFTFINFYGIKHVKFHIMAHI